MTDHLELRHGPTVIGVLERSSGSSVTLRYSNEVLDSVETGRIVVSCSAPVQQAPVNVTAWCRGLLPEGQHLHALAARADVAASDTFGLLRRYGRDIAGAFEIVTVDLPPMTKGPDLLVLATELAGVGGINLPVEVSAIDSFASVTDAPERSLSMVARIPIDLADVYLANDKAFCDTLDRCRDISLFLLERADQWLGED